MTAQNLASNTYNFEVKGLKKRGSQIEAVPVNACNLINGIHLSQNQAIAVGVKLEQFSGKEEFKQTKMMLFNPSSWNMPFF